MWPSKLWAFFYCGRSTVRAARCREGHPAPLAGGPGLFGTNDESPLHTLFYDLDFLLCQVVQFIDQVIDLTVGGLDLTLEGGFFVRGLGLG